MSDAIASEAVAIVGMAGRFPGARDVAAFWANLCDGVESIRNLSDEELAAAGVDPAVLADPAFVPVSAVMDEADGFDAEFFGLTRREAELTDPQHRVFLECAWSAIEHAGYDPHRYDGRIGVFGGVAANTYLRNNLMSDRELVRDLGDHVLLIASEREYAITRVAYKLGLQGPALSVNTACSTSAVAVHLASQSLLAGESDLALAGGARVRVPLTGGYRYEEDGILSPDGHCRAFDADARGTVAASGVAIIALKRLTDAQRDRDTIFAVIRGTAVNNDGAAKIGYTAPGVDGQVAVIEEALAVADVDVATIGMLEAHGTGTSLGDPIEVHALTQAFRRHTDGRRYCAIGSLKTNIGHLDAGAGVAGIIKAALSLHHERIPPSLNYERPNPQIDFDGSPFFVNTELRPWPRSEAPRRAGVSSFGLGGTNAHVVLEEAPLVEHAPTDLDRGDAPQLLVLSGKTATATAQLQADLADHLEADPDTPLADVAYTLGAGRARMPHRVSFVAASRGEAVRVLRDPTAASTTSTVSTDEGLGVAFLLPGQGAQYPGMGAGLYRTQPTFAAALDACAAAVDPIIGRSLLELMFGEGPDPEADRAALMRADIAQPATFAIEYAMARLWMSWGVEPTVMIGHSLGEFAAACLGGVFELEEALPLVASRGRMMQAIAGGGMLAVMAEADAITPLLDEHTAIAAVNGPAQSVVSGPSSSIDVLERRLAADDMGSARLPIELAAHSPMMEPMVGPFRELVAATSRGALRIPMVSTATGQWVDNGLLSDPGYWADHLRQTVRFSEAARVLLGRGDHILIEVGPGQTLSSLVRQRPDRSPDQAVISSMRQAGQAVDDETFLLGALGQAWAAGADIDWARVHREPRRRVHLPTYPFEHERFWIDPVEPGGDGVGRSAEVAVSTVSGDDQDPGAVATAPFERAPTDGPEAASALDRKDRIAAALTTILSELSGVEPAALDPTTDFADMGFDSLFLTQANARFRKAFGIRVTFRQLFDEAPTIDALAAFIDADLPADAFPAAPTSLEPGDGSATREQTVGPDVPAGAEVPGAAEEPDPVDRGANADRVERLVEQQLRLMEQQLRLLRSGGAEDAAHAVDAASAGLTLASVRDRAPSVSSRDATAQPGAGDAARPARAVPAVSDAQRQAIKAVVRRHDARTPRSKRLAQRWRPRLADNRTIVGFDVAWKELVYQIVTERSAGSRIWDVDGNEYIDTALGLGTNLLGHSPPVVVEAIRQQLGRGYEVSAQSDLLGDVAEMVCAMTANERMTFISSGSEAVAAAIRVARTVTGRDKVAYFSDDIHGRSDVVLGRPVEAGGELRTLPQVAGVPQRAIDDALVLAYGTEAALERIATRAHELALVLVEPVRTRNPDLQPVEFVRELRRLADERGFLLVFDEIVTGFRAHPGGVGAMWGIKPDITCYGKALGGGFPIGAIAGRSEVIDVIDGGPWSFGDDSFPMADITASGGTFIKHPVSLAAARAVLAHLDEAGPSLQADLARRTSAAARAINDAYEAAGIPIHIEHFSSFFRPTFTAPTRFAGLFHLYLREHGVHTNPPAPSFLSTAHSEADVEAVVEAYRAAGAGMAREGFLDARPLDGTALPAPSRPVESGADVRATTAVVEAVPGRAVPLTAAQRDIWLISQLGTEASAAYHITTKLGLEGPIDVEAMRTALRLLVERHESLRTTFDAEGDDQIVREHMDIELAISDVSEHLGADREARLEALYRRELETPYDMADGPLFRARLIRLDDEHHILVLSAHHLISDGWSLGVLQRDLGTVYSALVRDEPVPAGEITQFSEYVEWDAAHGPESVRYWQDVYERPPVPLDLPTDHVRHPVRTFESGATRALLGEELVGTLRRFAAAEGVTLFTVLLGAWEILLHRLSGQGDFATGLFVAGQASMGVRDLVGACANFVPLRSRLAPDEGLSDYLTRLKWATFDAYDHQHATVGELVSVLKIPRDVNRPTIVSTGITLETPTEGIRFEGLRSEALVGTSGFSAFDLTADLRESTDDVMVELQYSEELFDAATIERWLGHYTTLLRGMPAAAAAPISALRMLDDDERLAMLTSGNDTAAPLPTESAHQLFERQARRQPDRVAVRTSERSLTYGELNARANRLAHHLRDLGIESGRSVGVHLTRSPDVVVALLAVFKAGGVYVPLDSLFPIERLSMMAEDSDLHVLITQERLVGDIAFDAATVVTMDADVPAFAAAEDGDLGTTSEPSDLAYVIYTSGSTGRPKGVEVTHLALANDLTSLQHVPGIGADDVLLAVTTISFDPSLEDFLLPLISGATIVLADEQEAVDGVWLRERLEAGDITFLYAAPATWQMLLDAGWQGSPGLKALAGGEALGVELAAAVRPRVASLWNSYGTTETTITSAVGEVGPDATSIPLGRPLANTELFVLDPSLEPRPPGIPGELFIGGACLARGYRHLPDLTAERFIHHAFDGERPRRLYRTGDLVRRLADGRIEFLGRNDDQVKIRGYRIELGEIEAVLGRHPEVRECAVIARAPDDGAKRLVAYVVPAGGRSASVSDLRAHLLDQLPDYMVPSHFVSVEAMPLTPNGKVDRAGLPDPGSGRPDLATEMVAPRTDTEAALARIWLEHLDVELLGVEDNFFELGGDSLSALRCIMGANRAGMTLAPNAIHRFQTIAELARAAEAASDRRSDEQGLVKGAMPLTPAQRRFLATRGADAHHWNVSAIVRAPRLDTAALRSAVEAVLDHHDALRLRVWQEADDWQQEIVEPSGVVPFDSHDLSSLPPSARAAALERICSELQSGFDLGAAPLLRAARFHLGREDGDRFFVTVHHFAVDGFSWPVLWDDLALAYRQALDGRAPSLPPKTTSYREWARQLERLAQTPRIADTAPVWRGLPWADVVSLPLDRETDARANTYASTDVVQLELDAADTARLLASPERPQRIVIAALARSISRWTSSRGVLLDQLSHGRDAAFDAVNLSRTVGFAISYNPLVLAHSDWEATPEMLHSVVAQLDEHPEGFSLELLRFLSADAELREALMRLPRAEVLFHYDVDSDGDDAPADPPWTTATDPRGPDDRAGSLRQYALSVRATPGPTMRLAFAYSRSLHATGTIAALAQEVVATIRSLVRGR